MPKNKSKRAKKRAEKRRLKHLLEAQYSDKKICRQNDDNITITTENAEEAEELFPCSETPTEKMKEWGLPTKENPVIEAGEILYWAEAHDNSGYPRVIIRAIRGKQIPKKGFEKADRRGFVIWSPTLMEDVWEGKSVSKNQFGATIYKALPKTTDYREAIRNLLSALSS